MILIWMPILKMVTINETTIETYWWYPSKSSFASKSIKAIPILIPKEIQIKTIVTKRTKSFLQIIEPLGNPTFYHFIYSGSGALIIVTPLIGKLF